MPAWERPGTEMANFYIVTLGKKFDYDFVRFNSKKKTYKSQFEEVWDFQTEFQARRFAHRQRKQPDVCYAYLTEVQDVSSWIRK